MTNTTEIKRLPNQFTGTWGFQVYRGMVALSPMFATETEAIEAQALIAGAPKFEVRKLSRKDHAFNKEAN